METKKNARITMGHRKRWLESFDSNFKKLRDILVVFLLKDSSDIADNQFR
ncbi:MAG: hypothetical protein RJB05_610 [Armatimonadota bacterium]